jgi:hypothetical protein
LAVRYGWLAYVFLSGCVFKISGVADGGSVSDLGPGADFSATLVDFGPVPDGLLCVPNATACVGAVLSTCRADGLITDQTSCRFGCSGPVPHCLGIEPGGVATAEDYNQPGLGPVVIGLDTDFDGDTGRIIGGFTRTDGPGVINGVSFRTVTQVGGPTVGVFAFASLTLAAGRTISLKGKNAVAFISAGDVMVAGVIDARGNCSKGNAGPGGFTGGTDHGNGNGTGRGFGGNATGGNSSGGGGAGHSDIGSAGGVGGANLAGGAGGVNYDFNLLMGGSGGGSGGGNNGVESTGGGGGGAFQLAVNGTLTLLQQGGVNAGGCSGEGGNGGKGGSGGGSGGMVLLEAETITLSLGSALAANGGGGGGGDNGQNGTPGLLDVVSASGGAGNNNGSQGGAGGAKGHLNGFAAGPPVASTKHGGGGGGSAGRLLVRTRSGSFVNQSTTLSPAPGENGVGGKPAFVTGMASFQ